MSSGRFSALVVVCAMIFAASASLVSICLDAAAAETAAEMENPVVIIKSNGAPRESAVTRTYTAADYGFFIGWIENSGLKWLTIDVYDTSSGACVEVMHSRIRFASCDAYPSGRVDFSNLIVAKGRTYEFVLTPGGPVGSEALFFHAAIGTPPVAQFTYEVEIGNFVRLDASSSFDSDGYILEYRWNWGDGSPDDYGVMSSHQYNMYGLYVITLTVTDNDYLTSTMSLDNYPPPPPPPPLAFTLTVTGLQITADASSASDPDGTIVQYLWSWGDGSPNDTGATATHTYLAPGVYVVTLTVVDNDGNTRSSSQIVTLTG